MEAVKLKHSKLHRVLLSTAGSLPSLEKREGYPWSHIGYWANELVKLGFDFVGTGEPGWKRGFGMVERFTQDLGGIEIVRVGASFKSYCRGCVTGPEEPGKAKEVLENKYLRRVTSGAEVRLKATITDPVTIGLELIGNDPALVRSYPEIFDDVTESLRGIVEEISRVVDVVQFDCPAHVARPIREPWRYVNDLVGGARGKPTWIHIDGSLRGIFPALISEYRVEVLNFNLFGSEEKENFEGLEDHMDDLRDHGKIIAAACINTQIQDTSSSIEKKRSVLARLRKLKRSLEGNLDLLHALTPGCGLGILTKTAHPILKTLREAAKEISWG